MTGIQIVNSVTLNQLLNLSGPQFPLLQNGNNNRAGRSLGNVGTHLAQCLALVMDGMRKLRPRDRGQLSFSHSFIQSCLFGTYAKPGPMLDAEDTLWDKVQPLSLRGLRCTDESHRCVCVMGAWGEDGWGRGNL